ncbi:MAG TPA: tRNA (adenosine(37)-N6)-dimethylallyltransferase MiaA [Terriglobales bacterium]|nr:tRNA (adenosine(37)-N6)-dimethylallyltransferase MiaA [Terriglobales bacterium]
MLKDCEKTGPELTLVVVAGPTASGKTALAVALAEGLKAEIVNFDSVQLYRDFDVGAAKPEAEELGRVPHHLLGVVDARHPWTAGEYARQARPVIEAVGRRRGCVVLAGGTGFYLRALFDGLAPAPAGSPELREKLRRRAPAQLHRLLTRLDPEAAARIAAGDAAKAIRALEVRLLTGGPQAALWRAAPPSGWSGVRVLKLGLNPGRAALYERINARAARMFAGPLPAEARRLLATDPPQLRIWSSHNYKQACDIVLHGAAPAAALAEAQQEQRRYAKRQWTWFRADAATVWLNGFGDEVEIQQQAVRLAEDFAQLDGHSG